MTKIPTAPLLLGLAGLIPFLWGAATVLITPLYEWSLITFGSRFVAPFILLSYGTVILSFMSGVLWGFATKAKGAQAASCYALSVLPALWAFFMVGGGPTSSGMNLIFGFVALLGLDAAFSHWGLTPQWWLPLRVALTICVVLCLGVGVYL